MNNTSTLPVSSPSYPGVFRQTSGTYLTATPRLAYPPAQSFCVRGKHPVSLFNTDHTEAACTVGNRQPTASLKWNGTTLTRTPQPIPRQEISNKGPPQVVLEMAI